MANQHAATQSRNAEWETLFRSCRPLHIRYASGEMISQVGTYIAGIHLIIDGVVSDTVCSSRGGPHSVDVLGAGDFIGLEVLAHQSHSISSSVCRALTSVELLFVETKQWISFTNADPSFERSVLHYLAARYLQARRSVAHSASVEGQLCDLLQRLAECCGVSDSKGLVCLPAGITLQALGDLLDMSSRQLRQARQRLQTLTKQGASITFQTDEIKHLGRNV